MWSVAAIDCQGCPKRPFKLNSKRRPVPADDMLTSRRFPHAAIELKFEDRKVDPIAVHASDGWRWGELSDAIAGMYDPKLQRVRRIEFESLVLLMQFVRHDSSSRNQQRAVCRESSIHGGACGSAVLFVHDLGTTFAKKQINSLDHWRSPAAAIWSDKANCVTGLPLGRMGRIRISEAGRQYLSERLMQLSDAHILALLESARFEYYSLVPKLDGLSGPPGTRPPELRTWILQQWLIAFRERIASISEHTCPQDI
jgi:hypothetical protein